MATNLSKIDYSNKTIYVGLDVHAKKWYSTIICEDKISPKVFDAKPEQLANYLKKHYPNATYKVAYESGFSGYWAKRALDELGVNTIVIHAADIPTSDKDKVHKNDKNDSRKIALALRSNMISGIYVPSRTQQEHRNLIRRRTDLVEKATCIKNQLKAELKLRGIEYPEEFEKSGSHWSKKFVKWLSETNSITVIGDFVLQSQIKELKWLEEEIDSIEKALDALMQSDQYKEIYRILRSVPGIGSIHAASFTLEVMDIERFRGIDQYLSYIGLVPSEHSSGDSRRVGGMSRRCNRHLRKLFIEAAWVAVKRDLALSEYFDELKKRGMKSTVAIIKVARKLSGKVRRILLNGEEYQYGIGIKEQSKQAE